MTEYRLDCPDILWEAYQKTVSRDKRLEEPLQKHIAERVAESPAVDPEDRARAEQYMEERWG